MDGNPGTFAGAQGKRVVHFWEGFEADRIFSLNLLKPCCYKGEFCLRMKLTFLREEGQEDQDREERARQRRKQISSNCV